MSGLLPVEEAQARLLALRGRLRSENVIFSRSFGRYLSQDILAQYANAITNGKKIKINQAVLEQLYGVQKQDQQ